MALANLFQFLFAGWSTYIESFLKSIPLVNMKNKFEINAIGNGPIADC